MGVSYSLYFGNFISIDEVFSITYEKTVNGCPACRKEVNTPFCGNCGTRTEEIVIKATQLFSDNYDVKNFLVNFFDKNTEEYEFFENAVALSSDSSNRIYILPYGEEHGRWVYGINESDAITYDGNEDMNVSNRVLKKVVDKFTSLNINPKLEFGAVGKTSY